MSDQEKQVKEIMKEINKKYGEGSLMKLDESPDIKVETIKTGALSLDLAIGIGGIPRGRIIELFGPESSGKSTLAQTIARECQNEGGIVAYIDAENALDPVYAESIGVNINQLLLSQPDSAEQAIDIAEDLIKMGKVDFIIIDSVSAMIPAYEIENDMTKNTIGLQARLMSKAMRKLNNALTKSRTSVLFINQIREKVGAYGNPETTSGGRALKFYASLRIEIRRKEIIKHGDKLYGVTVKAKVVKNKVSTPFKEAFFDIIFGRGVRKIASIIDAATTYGVIEKSGSWYSYNGSKIGQGKEGTAKFLRDNKDLCKQIEKETKEIGLKTGTIKKEEFKEEKPKEEENKKIAVKDGDGIL